MESTGLTKIQKEIMVAMNGYPNGLSFKQLAEKLQRPVNTIYDNVKIIERYGLLQAPHRIGKQKYVYPNEVSAEENERSGLTEVDVALMRQFNLDRLELRILKEVRAGKSSWEVARKLGELQTHIEARMERSIPAKFEVEALGEAKKIFSRRKKELKAPLAV